MPVDFRRLVDGLGEVTTLLGSAPELAAVGVLLTAVRDATHAGGATFTEYGPAGGRVVVAQGTMAWALGQPVPPSIVQPGEIQQPYVGWVESMPPEAAQPLLARGLVAVAGHPVRAGGRALGAVHVYFTEFAEPQWPEVSVVLRVAAAFAERFYTGRETTPVRPPGEEDDRSLFLAIAGHELRTPVTVIKGYSSLLADRWESLDDDQRRSAARVVTQRADELARLVDRLLGTSAGDAATGGLVRVVPFDPLDALKRAAEAMPSELRRAVTLALPNWLPPAAGDPDVIGTVVNELVTNAVRAGDGPLHNGRPRVDLTAGADADTVYIQVLDRGLGIDPAQAEQAFERFWRAPHAPVGPGGERDQDGRGGVGLGLYLVRRLVERQNGWVSLRPRDGGGTIAEVRLARADGRAAGRAEPSVGADPSATGEA
jgi:signal transduction histidine kinase